MNIFKRIYRRLSKFFKREQKEELTERLKYEPKPYDREYEGERDPSDPFGIRDIIPPQQQAVEVRETGDIDVRIQSAMVIMLPESSQVERAVREAGLTAVSDTFSIVEAFENKYADMGGRSFHFKTDRVLRYLMKLYRWCDECKNNYGFTATLDPYAKQIEKQMNDEGLDPGEGLLKFTQTIGEVMEKLRPSMYCPVHYKEPKQIESD